MLEEIKTKISEGYYDNKLEYPRKNETMKEGYITDENKSVVWNREQVTKNIEEFNFLYDSVGWGHYEDIISKVALDNTLYSVSLYDEDKIIGYGRIIGDLACLLYIQDIMVRKEYQGKNVGSKIMRLFTFLFVFIYVLTLNIG